MTRSTSFFKVNLFWKLYITNLYTRKSDIDDYFIEKNIKMTSSNHEIGKVKKGSGYICNVYNEYPTY